MKDSKAIELLKRLGHEIMHLEAELATKRVRETQPTKKMFLVFGFDSYYPDGGWDDHKGSFDTFEKAVAWINADVRFTHGSVSVGNSDHYQVVDLNTMEATEF